MSRKSSIGLLALVILSAVTGCARVDVVSEAATPSASVHPAPSTPSASESPMPITCEGIVTPKALTLLTSGGNTFNPEFEAKVREEGNVELAQFLDFNGVACQWGQEGSDAVVVLAYARVTDAEARTAKNYLSTNGWVSSAQKDGSEAWSPSDLSNYLGNTPLCEFRSGNMRYMLDASSRAYFAV